MQIFGQVWLWSLGSFLLGVFFTWLLLVRPNRKRLIELEEANARPETVVLPKAGHEPTVHTPHQPQLQPQPQSSSSGGPGPNAADKFLDDLFETQKRSVPPLPSVSSPPAPLASQPSADSHTTTRPGAGDSLPGRGDSLPVRQGSGEPLPVRQAVADPLPVRQGSADPLPVRPGGTGDPLPVRPVPPVAAAMPAPEPIQSRLESGPTAPPEPPLSGGDHDTELSDNPFQRFTESTTVFVPPEIPRPPQVEPSGQDWFAKEDEDPHAITDVEDDENVDESGTIFTEHTTPIPADVIRSLDESQPPAAAPPQSAAELTQAMPPPARHGYDDHDDDDEPAGAAIDESPELEGGFSTPPQPLPAQVTPESEMSRGLFESVVPVSERGAAEDSEDGEFVPPGPFGPGSAMPLPGGGSPAPEFNVKASVTALRYCTQDNPQFDRIVAEVWFRTPSDAERVGFRVLS
ncbi:hypothetical protein [Actinocrispum sp. NPDC049592]|uniref:sunset domain-containing protein n=1 Tax=Actinocrispum sp. NPDC049592 TaxID=3154835 RepID=UPI00343444A1